MAPLTSIMTVCQIFGQTQPPRPNAISWRKTGREACAHVREFANGLQTDCPASEHRTARDVARKTLNHCNGENLRSAKRRTQYPRTILTRGFLIITRGRDCVFDRESGRTNESFHRFSAVLTSIGASILLPIILVG